MHRVILVFLALVAASGCRNIGPATLAPQRSPELLAADRAHEPPARRLAWAVDQGDFVMVTLTPETFTESGSVRLDVDADGSTNTGYLGFEWHLSTYRMPEGMVGIWDTHRVPRSYDPAYAVARLPYRMVGGNAVLRLDHRQIEYAADSRFFAGRARWFTAVNALAGR